MCRSTQLRHRQILRAHAHRDWPRDRAAHPAWDDPDERNGGGNRDGWRSRQESNPRLEWVARPRSGHGLTQASLPRGNGSLGGRGPMEWGDDNRGGLLASTVCGSEVDPHRSGLRRSPFRGVGEVEAQQAAGAYRVGFVSPISPGPPIAAFRQGAFHLIVHAANADTARTAHADFERTWNKRCPGVVTSLQEGGDELVTFFPSPTCSGQRCAPRTRLSGSTRSSDDA
jgi:hypothetical protein